MINIIICGANGKMGQVLSAAVTKTEDIHVVAGVDKFPGYVDNSFPVYMNIRDVAEKADIIIDFSRPEALPANLKYAAENDLGLIVATTGFSSEEKKPVYEAAKKVPIFMSANMSLGVNLQMELSKIAACFLGESCDIEIIEKHHNQKVDAPSGTALAIADSINEAFSDPKEYVFGRSSNTQQRGREIGFHSIRGGTISGEHNVMFIGTDEILEITHIAQSRQVFATGALRAARFLSGKPAGLYNMYDIINETAVNRIYEDDGQSMITLSDLLSSPAAVAKIFSDVAEKNIKIDLISQTAPSGGKLSLSFSMPYSDLTVCSEVLKKYEKGETKLIINSPLSKLTVEGAGMQRQSGVASALFESLAKKDIEIYIITTSETKISFCVESDKAKDAISAVSEAFSLK